MRSSRSDRSDRHLEARYPGGNYAPLRAGGSDGNHRSHSSLMPAKSSSSASTTVALTILSSELPAASRMPLTLIRDCRVCS